MSSQNYDFDSEPSDSQYDHQDSEYHTIVIGYYKLRGKAQVPRLLCQYLKIEYKDQLYSLAEWNRYKTMNTRNWDFPDVPFLKEGDFVVTQPTPMCIYLINRFGPSELLGKTLQQKAIVKMYVWTIQAMGAVININCQQLTPQQLMKLKRQQWKNNVAPRLQKYQEVALQDKWFLGYFTLIDLSMYELVRYMELIFPGQMLMFPRLQSIKDRVAEIPQIKQYEESERAVRQIDPTTLLQELKKTQATQNSGPKN